MPEIQIREYEDSDLTEVLDVLRLALGETDVLRRSPDLWAWKHELNPFGRSLVMLATIGTRVVGVRALMRWQLQTPEGTRVECARAVDTATHPDFHRRGIFRKLTLTAIDHARAMGIALIFNTPNSKSKPGYLSMGWHEIGRIGVMIRPSLKMLRSRHTGEAESYVRALPDGHTSPVDRRPAGLRTPRTHDYLKWRFESHPTAVYDSVNADDTTAYVRSNLRQGRRELIVSDVVGPAPSASLREVSKRSTADYLVAWYSRGPERAAALKTGLLPVPWIRALTLVARPLHEIPGRHSRLDDWDISLGDLELL